MKPQQITLVILYVVLALVAGLLIGQQVERDQPNDRKALHELVKGTCDISRVSDLISEQECGDAQIKYRIKYLCAKADNLKADGPGAGQKTTII